MSPGCRGTVRGRPVGALRTRAVVTATSTLCPGSSWVLCSSSAESSRTPFAGDRSRRRAARRRREPATPLSSACQCRGSSRPCTPRSCPWSGARSSARRPATAWYVSFTTTGLGIPGEFTATLSVTALLGTDFFSPAISTGSSADLHDGDLDQVAREDGEVLAADVDLLGCDLLVRGMKALPGEVVLTGCLLPDQRRHEEAGPLGGCARARRAAATTSDHEDRGADDRNEKGAVHGSGHVNSTVAFGRMDLRSRIR